MFNKQIFEFYPKGICWEATPEKYISSQEFIKLSKVLDFSSEQKSRIHNIATKLEAGFNDIMYHHLERCLTYHHKCSDSIRVCIDFSLLFPVCTIYTMERFFNDGLYDQLEKTNPLQKLTAAKKATTISYLKHLPQDIQLILIQTKKELERQPSLELLDYEECINTTIPGISRINDCGEMNLFNALFKEELSFI